MEMDSRRKPTPPKARTTAPGGEPTPSNVKRVAGAELAGRKPDHPYVTAFAEYLRAECHLADNSVAAYRRPTPSPKRDRGGSPGFALSR